MRRTPREGVRRKSAIFQSLSLWSQKQDSTLSMADSARHQDFWTLRCVQRLFRSGQVTWVQPAKSHADQSAAQFAWRGDQTNLQDAGVTSKHFFASNAGKRQRSRGELPGSCSRPATTCADKQGDSLQEAKEAINAEYNMTSSSASVKIQDLAHKQDVQLLDLRNTEDIDQVVERPMFKTRRRC